MAETAILFPASAKHPEIARAWLSRAAQARRIAVMLSLKDAELLEVYALECEAKALRSAAERSALAA